MGKRFKSVDNFEFVRNSYIASLLINEFSVAATQYPIIFVKDGGGNVGPYALLGLEQKTNLFVGDDGSWKSHYVPAIIKRYPFALGKKSDSEDDLLICIDEESPFISDDEGEPLFTEKGEMGPLLEKAKNFLVEIQKQSIISMRFTSELVALDLLKDFNVQFKSKAGDTFNLKGSLVVDEKKLNELPDDVFLKLKKRGALPLIYSHLVSLFQIDRLAEMHDSKI